MFSFFKERGIVEQHIAQLSSFSIGKRRISTLELARLIKEPTFRSDIIRLGGIALLAGLLSKNDDHEVQTNALIALNNCAAIGGVAGKTAIVQAGGISLCVCLLSNNKKALMQGLAAGILSNLAYRHPVNQTAIAQAGGIEPLIRLLSRAGYSTIEQNSALALCNLAFNHTENKMAIARAGGIQALVSLLSYFPYEMLTRQNAMSALFMLMKDIPANQTAILNERALTMLQKYSDTEADAHTKKWASEILNFCHPLVQQYKEKMALSLKAPKMNTIPSSFYTFLPSETTKKPSTCISSLSSTLYEEKRSEIIEGVISSLPSVSPHKPSPIEEWVARQDEREEEEAKQKERNDYRGRQVQNYEFWKYQREMAGGVEPSEREDHYQRKINKHDGSSGECRIS